MYHWAYSQSTLSPSPGRMDAVHWPPNKHQGDYELHLTNDLVNKSEGDVITAAGTSVEINVKQKPEMARIQQGENYFLPNVFLINSR